MPQCPPKLAPLAGPYKLTANEAGELLQKSLECPRAILSSDWVD